MFEAPIPGQSLTKEPKNAAWERPPETNNPDEAIGHHLKRLSDPEVLDNVVDALDIGIPVALLTEMILTGAVANGIHSIDISMMVAPVVHEHLLTLAEDSGVSFKEFFDEDGDEEKLKSKALTQALANLGETPDAEKDSGYEFMKETLEQEPEEPKSEGLMQRRAK